MVSLFFQKSFSQKMGALFALSCCGFVFTSCGGGGSGGVSSGGDSAGNGDGKVISKAYPHTIRFDAVPSYLDPNHHDFAKVPVYNGVTLDGVVQDAHEHLEFVGSGDPIDPYGLVMKSDSHGVVAYKWTVPEGVHKISMSGCSGANSGYHAIGCSGGDFWHMQCTCGLFPGANQRTNIFNDKGDLCQAGFGSITQFDNISFPEASSDVDPIKLSSNEFCSGGTNLDYQDKEIIPSTGPVAFGALPYSSRVISLPELIVTPGQVIPIVVGRAGVGGGKPGQNGFVEIHYTVEAQ
jgi:hypothetical protein